MKVKTKTAIFLYNANLYQEAINKILEIPENERDDDDKAIFIICNIILCNSADYITDISNLSSISYINDLELFKKYLLKMAKQNSLIDVIPNTVDYDGSLDLTKYDFFPKYIDTDLNIGNILPRKQMKVSKDPNVELFNEFINELKIKIKTNEDIDSFISTFDQSSLSDIKKLRILGLKLKHSIITKNYNEGKNVIYSILDITNKLKISEIKIDIHSVIAEFIYKFLNQSDISEIMESVNNIIENTPSEMNIIYDKYTMKDGLSDKATLENYIEKFRNSGYDISNPEHFNVLLDIQKGL